MPARRAAQRAAKNTDRELWREPPPPDSERHWSGDYFPATLHVTESGGIGMQVGGDVIVKPLRAWHALATDHAQALADAVAQERAKLIAEVAALCVDYEYRHWPKTYAPCGYCGACQAAAALRAGADAK